MSRMQAIMRACVNAPRLNLSHVVLDLPTTEPGRPVWVVIYRDGLPVRRQSPIQVVTTTW